MEEGAILFWIISTVIFLFILHAVIRSATDSTNMASNIQEIRDLLQELKTAKDESGKDENESGDVAEDDIEFVECPVCGNRAKRTERFCSNCGLKLFD
jgi:hypothetical protein